MDEPLTVYGVQHTVSFEQERWWHRFTFGLVKPKKVNTANVSEINKHFKALAANGVKKIGLEATSSREIKIPKVASNYDSNPHRYFKAITLRAQRAKLEVVDLENNLKSTALSLLEHVFSNAFMYDKRRVFSSEEFSRIAKAYAADVVMRPLESSLVSKMPPKKILRVYDKMVDVVAHNFSTFDARTFYELDHLMSRERSLEMANFARKQGVTHIVVGAAHAYDLQAHGHNVSYVNISDKEFGEIDDILSRRAILSHSTGLSTFVEKLRKCA